MEIFLPIINPMPNLQPSCKPLILCPSKPLWFTLFSYSISHQFSSSCSLCNAATISHSCSPPHSDITAWTGGWERVVQVSTLSVQSVSLLPPFFSQLDSGSPTTVLRPKPFFMFLSGVSLTPCHVHLDLSPCSLTLYLS